MKCVVCKTECILYGHSTLCCGHRLRDGKFVKATRQMWTSLLHLAMKGKL